MSTRWNIFKVVLVSCFLLTCISYIALPGQYLPGTSIYNKSHVSKFLPFDDIGRHLNASSRDFNYRKWSDTIGPLKFLNHPNSLSGWRHNNPKNKPVAKRNESECRKLKYLVYRCTSNKLCGGWGDRQKGIISSFILAILTNRTFVILMDSPCELTTLLQTHYYDWTSCMSYVTKVHKDARVVRAVDTGKNFRTSLTKMNFEQTWIEQIVYIHTNQIWIDLFRRNPHLNTTWPHLFQLQNAEIMSYVLNILFKPNDKMVEHLHYFFAKEIQSKELVCSHVRQGREPSSVDKVIQFIKRYDDKALILNKMKHLMFRTISPTCNTTESCYCLHMIHVNLGHLGPQTFFL